MNHTVAFQSDLFTTTRKVFPDSQIWNDWLSSQLRQPSPDQSAPLAIDLFAGCGGLSLGFECAGIRTVGYEMKPHIVETYNSNLAGNCSQFTLKLGDPPCAKGETADILMGGPPCQPFSQIGYQRGHRDHRDGFPIFLDAVNRLRPRLAIIENVRGLLFRNKDYLRATCKELERFGYVVDARLIDTSLYGVPQKRQRAVIIASKTGWAWPEPVIDEPVTVGVPLTWNPPA